METLINNHVKEYVLSNKKLVMIPILPENRLLIDKFGKLSYRSGLNRYRVVPYTSFCVL